MQSDIEEANREKALGNECFTNKNYEQAIKHFTRAIDLNSEDHVFYSNRSACYANLGEYDKALVDAQICCDLNPSWAKGYLRRGLAEFYLKKYDNAIKTYQEGLKIEPNNSQLSEGLNKVQEAKKSQPQAEGGSFDKDKFLQQAVNELKSDPETASFFQDKEFVEKINAIKSDPQKAKLYLGDPKIQKAFEVIQKKFGGKGGNTSDLKKEGSRAAAEEEKSLGNEAYKKKDFNQALYHYDKAIELNPNEAVYYNNKAAVYLELKENEKVIECCNKAISIWRSVGSFEPVKLAKALVRKGTAFANQKKYTEAIQALEESLVEYNDGGVRDELAKLRKLNNEN